MPRTFLKDMVEDLRFEDLPTNWNSFNLENFSKTKKLWDYQQEAVKNAIKVLYKYYEDFFDYQEDENLERNQERKEAFYQWYIDNNLDEDLDIRLDRRKRGIYNLLTEYYPSEGSKIPYKNFINRISFWMATGSGKSLVIIKLIQILSELIKRKEIPPYDILFLTHRDDLIGQLKRHIEEFNQVNEPKIFLRELREYPEVKRQPSLLGLTVFYYRSDNLSDEQKEKIIDFKNYDNNGRWYIFLDEAHKGDREESKRQHIYSILSKNGFLFNFSATFTDPRDIITCAYEFNLSSFIESGYGKHISVLKQEVRAFRDKEDYTGEEKQKIVLKSLILLTYIKKFYEDIKKIRPDLYHKPLLLTLVNSVNTEDADLKLFFRELEKIGKGDVDERVFREAISELWEELKEGVTPLFEDGFKIEIDEKVFKSITKEEVLNYVYNADTSGDIEILKRQSNNRELAFKLKTSDRPFALIKIGDISNWLKNELEGYEVQESYETEGFFENLNREDSEISILMGSRGFYEGWDSNRPNVINFINIGVGEDARKFILQSIGRGVRIEPIRGKRKRLLELYNAREVGKELYDQLRDKVIPIESLFIFGTNRDALITVIQELEKEKKREGEHQLQLFVNYDALRYNREEVKLLLPTYRQSEDFFLNRVKFPISTEDFELLKGFITYINDDRVLLMRYNIKPKDVKILRENLDSQVNLKIETEVRSFRNIDLLINEFFKYLRIVPEEFKEFKELEEEIKHFKNIKVYLKEISELQDKIKRVNSYPIQVKELHDQYGKITPEEYIRIAQAVSKEEDFEYDHRRLKIKYIANHYYLPLILSEDEKIDYIQHIIKTRSEVKFIKDLEDYLSKSDNSFKALDWWMFSKLDETLDEIYIPYYSPNGNRISRFKPDFIFWLKKGNEYAIFFVDPKGTEYTDAYRKIDGYKEIFEFNGKEKDFDYNNLKVKVKLKLRTEDISKVPKEYKGYWFDRIDEILEDIL
jgi:hypothetical protein